MFFPWFFGKESVFPWKKGFPSLKRQLLNEGEVDQGRLPRGKVSQGDAVPEVVAFPVGPASTVNGHLPSGNLT